MIYRAMTDEDQEPLDPRIQNELERLNKASLLINRLENDLDDARARFRTLLSDSTHQLENLSKKLGSCIERAKPYYDCRLKANEVKIQTHQAATKYERAMSMQAAAREMVELAEQGYESKKPSFDTAWQEMLNHATMKVMDAENERMLSEAEHQRTAQLYAEVEAEVHLQYKEHKRSIVKSKAYYERKADFHTGLEAQKKTIESLQTDVESAKKLYSKALSCLEGISEEIHERRQSKAESIKLGEREAGVGSESPVPPPHDQKHAIKAHNNNEESEIIISFPPVVSLTKDLPHSMTINDDSPDYPIDISGVQIDVSPAGPGTPVLLVNNRVVGEKDVPSQNVGNSITTNEQPEVTQTTNQQSVDMSVDSHQLDSTKESATENNMLRADRANDDSGNSSINTSPVVLRHKRVLSGSIKLSAKRLLHETSSVESDSGSVSSFVALDDNGVACAMSQEYFDGSFEEELRRSTHEDYSKLPDSLSCYQKPYETTRRSVSSYPPFDEADLKLEQVLKLLEEADDESVV